MEPVTLTLILQMRLKFRGHEISIGIAAFRLATLIGGLLVNTATTTYMKPTLITAIIVNKAISMMVIRPLDNPTYFAQFAVVDF